MRDDKPEIKENNQEPGIDRALVENLAKQLADSKRKTLETQHRINEVENGRSFRTIRFVKKSLVNPLWAIKKPSELVKIFKKLDVPPLPDPESSDGNTQKIGGFTNIPPSVQNTPRTMRYPHIKVASLGDPGIFSRVAHTFDVNESNWMELLDLGIEFLLISDPDAVKSDYAKKIIDTFRKNEGKAIIDKTTIVLWWITNKNQLDNSQINDNDVLLLADPRVYDIKSTNHTETICPSVDPLVSNPVNWLNNPTDNLFICANSTHKDEALALAKKIYPKTTSDDFVKFTESSDIPELGKSSKKYRAALCERKWFSKESAYLDLILNLMASGTPVITSGSRSLKMFMNEHLEIFKNEENMKKYFEELSSQLSREKTSIKGRNYILNEMTHLKRFEQVLKSQEIMLRVQDKISIILSTMRQKEVESGMASVAKQKWQNKELILILHRKKVADFDLEKINKLISNYDFEVKILDKDKDSAFGNNLNEALEIATGEFITKMDDDDIYGENHVHDLYLAYIYSGAFAVGKWANFVYLTAHDSMVDFVTHREERYVRHLPGATVFMRRSDARATRFGRVSRAIDSELYRRAEMRGARLYSTHRYNFIRVRHNDHTYAQDEEDFIANASSKPRPGLDKSASFL